MLFWHEAPAPRLFIVLPTVYYPVNESNPILDKFQFFWMCEFTDECEGSPVDGQERVPHLYHHSSLELARPHEFFEKYGDHLLQTLLMVKYGEGRGGTRQNMVSFSSSTTRTSFETGLDHPVGIQILQDESGLSHEDIELHLDLMIAHLQRCTTISNGHQSNLSSTEETNAPPLKKSYIPLQCDDFAQLHTFLVQRRTPNARNSTIIDSGANSTLHRQYRVVTKQGHVHWVCRPHMDHLRPHFNPEQVQRLVLGQHQYSSQNGQLVISRRSSFPLSAFHSFQVANASCVSELVIDVQSGMSAKEFYNLKNAVAHFGLASLDIKELGFIAPTSAERRPVSILVSNSISHIGNSNNGDSSNGSSSNSSNSSRIDPYQFLQSQSYSNTLWQILDDHPLQSLTLLDANHLLTQDWARKPTRPFQLRHIHLAISTKGKGLFPIRQGILNIVSNSPHLKDLKLVWDDLKEAVGEANLLKLIVCRSGADPTAPTNVCFVMEDRSTSLVIENGLFHDVELKAASLTAMTHHFLVLSGQLDGSLTVTGMADWSSTSPYIKMYLSKNPRLRSMDLQYPIEDFEKAEDAIVQILSSPIPDRSANVDSAGSINTKYHLREYVLRDTRGKNTVCARFIPNLPVRPLERISMQKSVDMVLIDKAVSADYHSFFSIYGHLVKSLILTADTAPVVLSALDKATAGNSSTIPSPLSTKLHLTHLVVSLSGLNIASTFHLHNILQRSKGTFKQLTLCGDIPFRSHFENETLLNLMPAFVGEQVVLLRQNPRPNLETNTAAVAAAADGGRMMQEWVDLVQRLLPEGVMMILAEDKPDLCRIVPGLTLFIAECLV
ncbi:hypothetical protein FBU30_003503 [Linnemannia zychae]|nr:hypothetical protein FBU30_003503 [Linnemannia zychae]